MFLVLDVTLVTRVPLPESTLTHFKSLTAVLLLQLVSSRRTFRELPANAVHQYFLKVVPTSFLKLNGEHLSTHQYSVTESSSKAQGLMNAGSRPSGVYFHYELSPIRVSPYTGASRQVLLHVNQKDSHSLEWIFCLSISICLLRQCFNLSFAFSIFSSSPQVDYKEHRNKLSEFLTSVCAIVGGVATLSGLFQSGVQLIVSYIKSSSKAVS